MNEKINELLKDASFLENLLTLETEAEAQAFLAENGIELSTIEIVTIKNAIASKLGENEELSEDDLECVAGGADNDFVSSIIEGVGDLVVKLGDAVDKWTRRRW